MMSNTQPTKTDYYSLKLTPRQFEKISRLVYEVSGIDLHEGKEDLVKARLLKRLRHLNLANFDQYFKYLNSDRSGREIKSMVDILTTNKTEFFREPEHLLFLKENVVPLFGENPIRIWSAGCSSGEEPYSIAITLCESVPNIAKYDIKILATDISERMVEKAQRGEYSEEALKDISAHLKHKYFQSEGSALNRKYKVIDEVRYLVKFAKLNLMDDWPMSGPFDVIFCRNVMIYFNKPTQEMLINRFWHLLREEGYLLVGHSESLNFLLHDFLYVKPAVYQKTKLSHPPRKKSANSNERDDA
jgi:chemotaxis protein methyltransferase CheR